MNKICITGSAGFIASHVSEALKYKGIQVIGLQRHSITGGYQYALPNIIYFGDLRDKELVEKAIQGSEGVIHLAGILGTQETVKNPYPSVEVNIFGTLNVLEACKIWDIPMVYISVGNYWMNNSYSITNSCAERFVLMYSKENGVKGNVVRGLNAFGERQRTYPIRKMMPSFILRALKDEPIEIYGSGEQKMDFVYVKDVAGVLIDVLMNQTESFGNIFEAGLGYGLSVNELAQKVIHYSGSKSEIIHVAMRPGEEPNSEVIAQNPYPYNYTNLDEALQKTIEWYRNYRD